MNRNTSHGGLTLALVGATAVCALPAQAEIEPQLKEPTGKKRRCVRDRVNHCGIEIPA